ncbi:hypothetical protein [Neopusillimonas aromaticivorans]|uniref:hypothetical protein n=1 Tax=Neopusillimonas aromaticivorans TaxID=2979868 RepID=UPI0025991EE7|nr:hypothetical protein [Neopusillimonas aromaticivorans]WJJ93761.1 hypothetical protein N7E01_00325 [Neopusillimonas aromaticivorans]
MQKGIVDLEKMFSDAQGDPVVLRQLKAELKHRKLARAFTLLKKVEAALAEVQQQSGTETESTEKSVVSSIEGAPPRGNSKASRERGGEKGSIELLIFPSPPEVKTRDSAAGGERADSRSTQRGAVLLTLEESYRALGLRLRRRGK